MTRGKNRRINGTGTKYTHFLENREHSGNIGKIQDLFIFKNLILYGVLKILKVKQNYESLFPEDM